MVGTICSYPKFTPVPFQRGLALAGLPRGDQRAVRHRQAGPARAAAGQPRRSTARTRIYLMPTNLYGPGDKFHPAVSHVIPALIKKCVDAEGGGRRPHRGVGHRLGQPRVPLRRRRRRGHRARRRALRRRRPREPRRRPASCRSASSSSSIVEARRLRGRGPVGHVQARRPAPPAGRRQPGRGAVRLRGPHVRSTKACAAPSTGTSPTATRPKPATV